MAEVDILTIRDLRNHIKLCKEVLAIVRFGVNDRWTKISKQTAFEIIEGADANQTPDDFELYASRFGIYDAEVSILYFG